jgi:hypothetical protein
MTATGSSTVGSTPGLKLAGAKPFTPFKPAPVDKEAEKLKSLGVTAEEEIKDFKALLKELKEGAEASKKSEKYPGSINFDIFMKVGELVLCKTMDKVSDDLSHCLNPILVDRDVKDFLDQQSKKNNRGYDNNKRGGKNYNNNYQKGGGKPEGGNDFNKGTAKPYKSQEEYGMWKQEVSKEQTKLREEA